MKKVRRCLLVAALPAVFCQLPTFSSAQDIHFSQFMQAPLQINPSQTGFYEGFYRGSIHYRNQWSSMGKAYSTAGASFDMPFKVKQRKSSYFAAGLFFFSDKAGDAGFGTTNVALSGAGIVPLSPYMKISGGINAAFTQQSANVSKLTFANQYTGTGFDPNINSNENGASNSFTYIDVGAGFSFQYSNAKSNISRDDVFRINLGIAGFHLNQPKQSFFSGGSNRLLPRYVGHADARIDIPATKFSVVPSLLYMMQGPSMELTVGAGARYRLKNGTKITGAFSETAISLVCHYRLKDAVIPQIYFEFGNIAGGISYDLNISSYKEISHLNGGFEISIKYINLLDAIFEKRI
ncbi:MAG: PorP/SprF family type IX secretion system membrane protein [Bacteroidota bacterium]